jgi:hypothetical protein
MNIKILILSLKKYSVVDKETGVLNEGMTLRYIPQGSNLPNGSLELAKASIPIDPILDKKLSVLPATCTAVIAITADTMGKPTLKLKGFEDIKPYKLEF